MNELAIPLQSSAPPALIIHPHALVGDGRIIETAAFRARETLQAYIERTSVVVPSGPVAVWHNGFRVPDALWQRLIPCTGDLVIIRSRALGGGGTNKVIASVALIALAISAPYLAGALQGLSWGTAATGFIGGALTAGIMIGGSFLITPLFPEIVR